MPKLGYRKRTVRRRRINKPGLQATILTALISQFQWSGYSDNILEEPETIRKALLGLYENEEIWNELNSLSLTVRHIMKLKGKM